jgi:FkbM family methyltransferase
MVCLWQKDKKLVIRALATSKISIDLLKFLEHLVYKAGPGHSSDYQDKFIQYRIEALNLSIENFFYIDVGASDGFTKSNTKILHDMNINGICIEANPTMGHFIKKNQPRSQLVNKALVPKSFNRGSKYSIKSGNNDIASSVQDNSNYSAKNQVKVGAITVKEFLHQYRSSLSEYDYFYLSIDIEGLDLQILEDFFRCDFYPNYISVEHNHHKQNKMRIKNLAYANSNKLMFNNFFRNEFILVKET